MKIAGPKFLLISDNTSYAVAGPRYLGPYRIAHELEAQGIQTFVLDKFYSFPDFFKFLELFLDEDFIGVGLSTTFFTPPEFNKEYDRYTPRHKLSRSYYDYGIISNDPILRKNWFEKFRAIITEKSPKAKVFVGGAKAQFFANQLFNDITEIDYLVMGVVDKVFPEVLKDLIAGRDPHYKMMGNKRVVDTALHYKQPKVCPPHDWKKHWFVQPNEPLPIEIGRGCAFNCKFCNYDKNENFRKSLTDLKQEFISNYENFGVQNYHFVDDCFNDSRAKVEEVGQLLLSLPFKVEWASYVRFDVAVKFPETADLIVESGGRALYWGVESLTHEVARRAGKGTPSDKIKDFIVNFSKKYRGICYSTGSFISGLPGETEASWKDQFKWLIENESFDFIQLGPLAIAPYKHEFDGVVVDSADYSRNPQKYGFTDINMATGEWTHETMNHLKAIELAQWAFNEWEKKLAPRKGMSSNIWVYPILRSLGYTPEDVREIYFNTSAARQEELRAKGRPVVKARNQKYFEDMWSLVGTGPMQALDSEQKSRDGIIEQI